MTRDEFVTAVKSQMDAESSARWSPETIVAQGGIVSQTEWEGILNQNRFYRFATRAVTTDSDGRIAIADLTSGSGDTTQYFYRVLDGFTDGQNLYSEVNFDDVPMATISGSQDPSMYAFYLAGDYFQILQQQSGLSLTCWVNHTPPSIAQLASGSSVIVFPTNYEYILVWVTAATLLMKGAAESQAASDLMQLADGARKRMLGSVGRRTTRPTFSRYPDSRYDWGS